MNKNLQPKDACEKLRMKVPVVFQAFSWHRSAVFICWFETQSVHKYGVIADFERVFLPEDLVWFRGHTQKCENLWYELL